MRRLLGMIGLTIALAAPADAQTDETTFQIAAIALMGSAAADVITTRAALARPHTREANGLMADLARHPIALTAVKLGTTAALEFYLAGVRRAHPRLAFWCAAIGAGAWSIVAIHNAHVHTP